MSRKYPYQNPHQKGSPRLYGYDYSSDGWYFITICTKDRMHYFGQIDNRTMNPSKMGEIIIEEWLETPGLRMTMNIELDEFCLMPNQIS